MMRAKEEGIDVYAVHRENHSKLDGRGKGCAVSRVRAGQMSDGKIRSQTRPLRCTGAVITGHQEGTIIL